ncbi:MAG: hypothetical protein D8M56_17625 [Chloroflexi bacterium]|nr:hypothetical protein [Chloroflexota bacterium]
MDTSPLITLCKFKVRGQLIVDYLLPIFDLQVVETVAQEATANPAYTDAKVVQQLLNGKQLTQLPVPTTSIDAIINGYTRLGLGEQDTIRLGITNSANIVLDDYLAFVVGTRFDLRPLLLLDLLVLAAREYNLDKAIALEIVDAIQVRYSSPFVEHTRHKLKVL